MKHTKMRIEATGLVPVVVIHEIEKAVPAAKALLAGGVDIMEITVRTAQGLEAIQQVSQKCPEMLVGCGTVLTMEQCKSAIEKGAKFIVSPGFDQEIVQYCISKNTLVCPGCATPTEITAALKCGLDVVKFFPANVYGGLKAIKALRGPFSMVRFIPTGGVDLKNLADFRDPSIFAVGGGWLFDTKLVKAGEFAQLSDICAKSVSTLLGLADSAGVMMDIRSLLEKGGGVVAADQERTMLYLLQRGYQKVDDGATFVCDGKGPIWLV